MNELIPKFEQSSGHKVRFDYGTVGGMTDRIQRGEAADVGIVSGPQIALLEKQSKIAAGSRVDLARTGVGIFVRKGASKPDIRSVEAFKRTMLAAKSIGYTASPTAVCAVPFAGGGRTVLRHDRLIDLCAGQLDQLRVFVVVRF